MNLGVENWAQENLSENAMEIMKESIICYKTGAYRAAFLMSYLAFKQTVRERILQSPSYPECYNNDMEWKKNVLKKLKNDDEWENFINEIVKANSDGNKLKRIFIFNNRERCLNRYTYWKDIRNSCAHAKDEHINLATVEQFWNYMQDDLGEFYVLGGKKYLMNELTDSYKYYISDNGKNLSRLLQDIKIVYRDELKQFFIGFLDKLLKEDRNLVNDLNLGFWKNIINCNHKTIQKAFALSISEREDLFLSFYKYFPEILNLITSINLRFMQDYINPLLCKELCYRYMYRECFGKILVNALEIHSQSIEIDSITGNYENLKLINNIELNQYEKNILNEHGIFKAFIFNAGYDFFKNDANDHWDYYNYGSGKSDEYIIKCFSYIKWDKELIKKMDTSFGYLKDSIKTRSNFDSISNGNSRISAYTEILINNKEKIENLCIENDINLDEYIHIQNVFNDIG